LLGQRFLVDHHPVCNHSALDLLRKQHAGCLLLLQRARSRLRLQRLPLIHPCPTKKRGELSPRFFPARKKCIEFSTNSAHFHENVKKGLVKQLKIG